MLTINKNKILNRYLPMFLSVVLIVAGVFSYLTFHNSTKTAEAAWYSSSWGFRKVLVIDHTKVSTASSTTLSNFPVLFSQTDANLKTVANGGGVGKDDGSDILFTLGDGVTKLSHEIESYSSSTGATIAWINIPSLSPSVDTTLYIYYGNAGAANQQNVTGVWDGNYKEVYHLPNGTSLSANDSTGLDNGTLSPTPPTAVAGQIDGAASFGGSSYIDNATTTLAGIFTFSAWFNSSNNSQAGMIFGSGDGTSVGGPKIGIVSANMFVRVINSGNDISVPAPSVSNWHYVVITRDASNKIDLYLDGGTATRLFSNVAQSGNFNAKTVGANGGDLSQGFNGKIDDFRISNVNRSPDWIKTEYNNQSSPNTFFKTYGSQQAYASQSVAWYGNIARIGSASASCGFAVTSCSVTYSPTAGDMLEVLVHLRNDSAQPITSVTDNATGGSSSYTAAFNDTNVGTHYTLATFYVCSVKSGANTITANFPSSGDSAVIVVEYRGIASANCLDQVSSRGTLFASNAVTTTQPAELLSGYFEQDANGTNTFSGTNGFATVANQAAPNGEALADVDDVVAATGSYKATASGLSGGSNYIITFKSLGSWSYRKPITINHNQISQTATTTFSSFPMEISVTDPDLKYTGSGGKVASSTGADILFTDSNGTSLLNYEIESYASTTGNLIAWVRIPTLTATSDYTIYEYFGNASAPAETTSNIQNTWDSNYKGVWHLGESAAGAAGDFKDSTSNATNSANISNEPTRTGGWIGNGQSFNGSSSNIKTSSSALSGAALTLSAWIDPSSVSVGPILSHRDTSGWMMQLDNGHLRFYNDLSGGQETTAAIATSTWNYVVVADDGSTAVAYINGVGQTLGAISGSSTVSTTSIGAGGGANFAGIIDEARMSTINRSADWIKTEYNNQKSPSSFYTYGALQSLSVTGSGGSFKSRGASSLGWYNPSWSYRKPIIINHNQISQTATTTFSSFPVEISVTDNDLKYTGSGGKVASSTGADILFTDSNGTSLLNYEIESYASSTGNLIAWVRIPTLTATSDYTIYEYFGNASAPAETTSNIQNTWDSNYKGVWHLPNGTTLTANDSTGNGNNGTPGSGASAITGKVDGGVNFTGSSIINDKITLTNNSGLDISSSDWTVEGWLYASSTTGGSFGGKFSEPFMFNNNGMEIENAISAGTYAMSILVNNLIYERTSFVSTNAWHHFVATRTGSTYNLYTDGILNNASPMSDASYSGLGIYSLGNNPNSPYAIFGGNMDEIRVSSAVRSADWIKTEYNNQSSPSNFYAYGALAVNGRQSSSSAPAPAVKIRGGVKFR